jgi:glycosyltransferase involved in cell wall biosynthesis
MKANIQTIAIEAESIADNNTITGIGRMIVNYIARITALENSKFDFDIISMNHNAFVPHGLAHCRKSEILEILKEAAKNNKFGFLIMRFVNNYWRISAFSKTLKLLVQGIILWYISYKRKFDLLIQTNPSIPPLFMPRRVRLMVFVYDYVWFRNRSLTDGYTFLTRWAMIKSIKNADVIITISDYIKYETEKYFNKKNVFSIKLAAEPELFFAVGENEINSVREKYSIHKPYILSVCTLEPRKNLTTLIQAYAQLEDRKSYDLVLAGMPGWKNKDISATRERLGVAENIIFTGYVPNDDLRGLYSGALMFVYPSLYEGFGLPVLEAMQCGCPVIISNTSSLPEVVGDAGITVDPGDITGFRNAMQKLAADSELRDALRKKGITRAATFSWDKSFQMLMDRIQFLF